MTMTMQMMMTMVMIQHLYKWDNSCPPRWSGRPQGKSTWGSPAQAPTCRTQLSRPCNHSYDSCFLFLQRNIFYITISHVGGFKCDEHLHSQRVHLRGTKVSPCVRWGVSSSRGSQAAVGEDFVAEADFFSRSRFSIGTDFLNLYIKGFHDPLKKWNNNKYTYFRLCLFI